MVENIQNHINVVENGEQILIDGLANGKVVRVERIATFITELDLFNSIEELIESHNKSIEGEEYEFGTMLYLTKRQGYLLACNNAYYDYIEDFVEGVGSNTFDLEKQAEKFRELISYDEYSKRFDENNFVDGFYDLYDGLLFPLTDGENTSYEYPVHIATYKEDEYPVRSQSIQRTLTLEILFPIK